MPDLPIEAHLPLLKVLANETRLRLVGLVARGEHSVGHLARSLKLTEPTISHHLAKLSQAGLLAMRASGTTHYYRLDANALQSIGKSLFGRASKAAPKPTDTEEGWEARVLQSFIVEGRVTKIPEGYRKRIVVLRWLVNQFKDDRIYKEREVNEIVKRFHPDFATIRREFIGHGLMERESGTYWKTSKQPPH